MQADYLIVGQGIAGTVLATTLIKKGASVVVLSDEDPHCASIVAAGLYNPVTGKRMSKTWRATDFFPSMETFYREFEKEYSCNIVFPKPIYKPFATIEEQNTWLSAHEGEAFVNTNIQKDKYSNYIATDFGGFETKHSGHIDLPRFLKTFRKHLQEKKCLLIEKFNSGKLSYKEGSVNYGNLIAKKIIFCEGMRATHNPLFAWLPFVPSKGEILKVKIDNFTEEVIFNKQVFIVPLGNSTFRVGSTYEWAYESGAPTEAGKMDLSERLESMIKKPFEIIEHTAGIRPSVKDRKPIIGYHPENKSIAIFNGLGTKGVSMAPFFAEAFSEFLINDMPLEKEVNIERFYSLYSRSEI